MGYTNLRRRFKRTQINAQSANEVKNASLTMIAGCGKKSAAKLLAVGIHSVRDLKHFSAEFIAKETGIKKGIIEGWQKSANNILS